jgi:pimeloyl-ACP methyl ester carboxylesterase
MDIKASLLFLALFLQGCTSLLYQPTGVEYASPKQYGLNYEEVALPSKVHGWYINQSVLPKPKGVIVFFHGNAQNRSSHFLTLAFMPAQGFDYFIFDYRGYADSVGDPSPESTSEDGREVVNYIAHRTPDGIPIIIFGQSLGGAIALRTLETLKPLPKNLKLVVLDATFMSYRSAAASVLSNHWITYLLQPLSILVSDSDAPKQAMDTLPQYPLFEMHGTKDQVINEDLGEKLFKAYPGPKTWVAVPEATHGEDLYLNKGEYRKTLLDWIAKNTGQP